MHKKYFVAILFALSFTTYNQAQVSVGTGSLPITGALLDIREHDATNLVTSSRGLGMPRVNLVSATALSPMLADTTKAADKIDHVGLVVYNLNECLHRSGSDKGLHVWDGTKWQPLMNKTQLDKVKTFTDQDGNKFRAAQFGGAGIWMVDNARAKTYDTKALGVHSTINTLPEITGASAPRWAYPSPSSGNGMSDAYLKAQPNLGLLYNWYGAAGHANHFGDNQGQPYATTTPQANEVEVLYESVVGAKDGKIQGICPNGWHLPSDRDWNNLEREMHNNASLYSTYTSSTADVDGFPFSSIWNPAWEYGTDTGEPSYTLLGVGWRPTSTTKNGHGHAMISLCSPIISAFNTIKGKSLAADKGGFDAPLVGFIDSEAYVASQSPYIKEVGKQAYFWTSSKMPPAVYTDGSIWGLFRSFSGQPNDAGGGGYRKTHGGHTAYFSVRCKKDFNDFEINEPPFIILCGTGVANGAYVNGRALVANENTITIKFNAPATSAGNTINFSTNTVDGISFSGTATIQAAGGIQEATLKGSGTPNTANDKSMTITATGMSYTTTCAVTVEMVRPALRVLFLGENNTAFHYNFNPDGASQTWRLINTAANYGNLNSSKVKTDGIIRISPPGDGNYPTDDFIKEHLITNPVDMVVVSWNNQTIRTVAIQRGYFRDYMAAGGTAIINQESTPTNTQIFLRDVLKDDGIVVKESGGAGTIYTFKNTNHEILNGPFGDVKGKKWGEDATRTLAVSGFKVGSVTPLSDDFNDTTASNNLTSIYTPNGSYTTFVHNTMNFIWTGDGGYNSDGNATSNTICPFVLDGSYYPVAKLAYGNTVTVANRVAVYNAVFTANTFAYAIKKVYENKAKKTQP